MCSEKSESKESELTPRQRELMRLIEKQNGWFSARYVKATKAELRELEVKEFLESSQRPYLGAVHFKMKQQLCDGCGQPFRGGCLCSGPV